MYDIKKCANQMSGTLKRYTELHSQCARVKIHETLLCSARHGINLTPFKLNAG